MIVLSIWVFTGIFALHLCFWYLLIDSVRFLPANHDVRAAICPFLDGDPEEQLRQSQLPPPPPRTHSENKRNGEASQSSKLSFNNKKHPSKANGKKCVDVFSRILPYWDR
jgi:hypothetical protein